jgi:hypothetical protein
MKGSISLDTDDALSPHEPLSFGSAKMDIGQDVFSRKFALNASLFFLFSHARRRTVCARCLD